MFFFVSALVQLLMNEERREHLYPFSVTLSAHAVPTPGGYRRLAVTEDSTCCRHNGWLLNYPDQG